MNKSYLVIGVVVIAILLGVCLFKSQKQPAPPIPQPQQTVTQPPTTTETGTMQKFAAVIKYADSGFAPASVTIKKGETVEWINESSNPMWVASSPHPQHTDYPGFDELKAVGKGESYTFSFDKAGNWKYHNHLDPKDHGVVIVQE